MYLPIKDENGWTFIISCECGFTGNHCKGREFPEDVFCPACNKSQENGLKDELEDDASILGDRMTCPRCNKEVHRLFFGIGEGSSCWDCRIIEKVPY